ncbi:MAG: hypothetical protein U5N86_12400 [Planctomycetota bacterium]|nr:hypothetical protein [Planctomycetota bacterium]
MDQDRYLYNGATQLDSLLILSKFFSVKEKLVAVHPHESAGGLTHRVQLSSSTLYIRFCSYPSCIEPRAVERFLRLTTSGVNAARLQLTDDYSPKVIGNSYQAMLIDCGRLLDDSHYIAAMLGRLDLAGDKPLAGESVVLADLPDGYSELASTPCEDLAPAIETLMKASLEPELQYALATPPFLRAVRTGESRS